MKSFKLMSSNDILKLPGGLLEKDQAVKLFDMKKFQQNINREMKRQRPERNKLESQVRLVTYYYYIHMEAPIPFRVLHMGGWEKQFIFGQLNLFNLFHFLNTYFDIFISNCALCCVS
jgi:hypothetical protein